LKNTGLDSNPRFVLFLIGAIQKIGDTLGGGPGGIQQNIDKGQTSQNLVMSEKML